MKINDPPILETLKATVGIDSIHISIKMNKYDLERFCKDNDYVYKEKKSSNYQRIWLLVLTDGEPITATYHFRSKTIKFEIGNLLNYSTNFHRHEFIQKLFSYFFDREFTLRRIDIAVDINKKRDDLMIKNLSKNLSKQRVKATTYDNAKAHVFIAYDKSDQLKIFSTDLCRLEWRVATQLTSWKVNDCLSNKDSFDKLVKKVDEHFRNKIEIYSNDGLTQYIPNIDIESVLTDFIAFAQGDDYKYKNHFRIKEAIEKRDRFFTWMNENKLTPTKVNRFVKGRRAAVYKEIGLDDETFKKAVNFYKAIRNFKF